MKNPMNGVDSSILALLYEAQMVLLGAFEVFRKWLIQKRIA